MIAYEVSKLVADYNNINIFVAENILDREYKHLMLFIDGGYTIPLSDFSEEGLEFEQIDLIYSLYSNNIYFAKGMFLLEQ